MHVKRGKVKLTIHILSQKMWLLQTNSNISILYTIGNHFLPWLRIRIRDRYLKMMLNLTHINYQSFTILHGKACCWFELFRRKRRVPLRQRGRDDLVGTLNRRWVWSEMEFCRCSTMSFPRRVHGLRWRRFGSWEAILLIFSTFWDAYVSAWGPICCRRRWSKLLPLVAMMREKGWDKERNKAGKREREAEEGQTKGEKHWSSITGGISCDLQRELGITEREDRERREF